MNYNSDPYFDRPEVSNSDLSWIKDYYQPQRLKVDKDKAYKFGTLVDAIITEPEKVDYYQHTVDGIPYDKEDFESAIEMKKAFMKDELSKRILSVSNCQTIMIKKLTFSFEGIDFELDTRCKWDLWSDVLGFGGDIKSTAATSQKQFEEAVRFFDYDRQRAWYMNIAGSDKDVIIGISKKNYKVFKVPVRRGDELFENGVKKYSELAFKWWSLFEGISGKKHASLLVTEAKKYLKENQL